METLAEDSLLHSLRDGDSSTTALAGDNQAYTTLENQITAITSQHNMIASQIRQLLDGAKFQGNKIDEHAAERSNIAGKPPA
ncbi:MAG TPA: hypothetical protein VGJ51_14320 [Candidatus Angelobacter sp.]